MRVVLIRSDVGLDPMVNRESINVETEDAFVTLTSLESRSIASGEERANDEGVVLPTVHNIFL
jgi:hypothetical protein